MEKHTWKFKVGLALILLSTLTFALLPALPFIDTTDRNKIIGSTIIVIVGEVLFWSGGLLLGQQIIAKYKAHLNPRNWFK